MPLYFPSTGFYSSPSISNNNIQLFSQRYKPLTATADALQQNPWASNSGFLMNPYPYSYFYSSNAIPSISNEYLSQTTPTPTPRPKSKFPEPTTKRPSTKASKSNKLSDRSANDLKSDTRLISAVKQVNPTFEIENIVAIPGTPYFQLASVEKFPAKNDSPQPPKKIKPKTTNQGLGNIKVEATGKTSAGGNVPEIPFGAYFLPYNSNIETPGKKTASLILQPSSKAIVGNGGTAISAPISRAILKKGVPTNVFFNPESVAIAGAGGRAHAQADLILDIMEVKKFGKIVNEIYNRSKRLGRLNSNGDVVSFPYYGGLKGHTLNVGKDGKINTVVVLNPKYAEGRGTSDTFFNKIQDSAARLVAIQEKAKQKGSFSEEDNKSYADSLFELGLAAQSLAQLQQSGEIKDFSKLLQGSNTQSKPQPANDNPLTQVGETPSQNGDNMFVSITQEDPYEDSGESILVNAPKKEASVAEAKPVGLSIAGEGGVASSKPNAVAISGREGLAVSAPKATAIAGVSPEEAAAFSINVPTRNDIIIKAQQRRNLSGPSPQVENKLSDEKSAGNVSENEAQKTSAQIVQDSRLNILLVEPTFADRIGFQEKHQTSKIQADAAAAAAAAEAKGFRTQHMPVAFDESKYLNNMAYRNFLLSSS